MQSSLSCKPYISLYASTYLKEREKEKEKPASSRITYPHCCQYSIFCPDFWLLFHFFPWLPHGHHGSFTTWKFHNMACQAREVALIFIFFLFFCFQRLWATDSNWKAPAFITETQLRRFAGHLSAKLLCSFRNVETTLWGVGVLIVSTGTWIYSSLKHRQVIIKKKFLQQRIHAYN